MRHTFENIWYRLVWKIVYEWINQKVEDFPFPSTELNRVLILYFLCFMVFGKECTNQPNDPIKLTIIDMQVTRKYGLLDFSIIMRSALLIFGKYYYINLYLICFRLEKWKITRNSFFGPNILFVICIWPEFFKIRKL